MLHSEARNCFFPLILATFRTDVQMPETSWKTIIQDYRMSQIGEDLKDYLVTILLHEHS